MTFSQIVLALVCVGAISSGQLLFKRAGIEIEALDSWQSWRVVLIVGLAALIYGLATLLWIHLLRGVALNKAYFFMALSFILVPLASHFAFREPISIGLLVGAALVFSGLVVAVRFG